MATNVRDPRSIVTPDAFEVDPALLGTPLAPPGRRAFALVIDLIVIGTLTALTSSVALVVWGAVAVFLVSMAFRRPTERMGQVTGVLFRGATGCLGTMILLGVGIGFLATRADLGVETLERTLADLDAPARPGDAAGGGDLLRGIGGAAALRRAADTAEARQALETMLSAMASSGVSGTELADAGEALRGLVPAEASWIADFDLVLARAMETAAGAATPLPAEEDSAAVSAGLPPEVAALVADTLTALSDSLAEARARAEDLEDDLEAAQTELDEREEGFLALLRDIWAQLGSAIGLWSVYFTVALTLTKGRTVGKKAMGLRVLRLDGEPITWWFAFERAGGYAAGIATGLLGFAQIYWDPNRQCVHDKIGGTVVVLDGAEPIPGAWQEAWRQQQEEAGP